MVNIKARKLLELLLTAGLVLWGGYTFLAFLGATAHAEMFAMPRDIERVVFECRSGGAWINVCQGIKLIGPDIANLWSRLALMRPYLVLSLVLGSGLWLWKRLGRNRGRLKAIKVWQLLVLSAVLTWGIFNSLVYWSGAKEMRVVPDLTRDSKGAQVFGYESFRNLLDSGCLRGTATEASYQMKGKCIQIAFGKRVIPAILFAGLVVFELLIVGRFILGNFGKRELDSMSEFILSLGLGVGGWVVTLWFLAVFSAIKPVLVWVLFIVTPAVFYKQAIYWLKKLLSAEIDVGTGNLTKGLLVWLLLSYLGLALLQVIRPAPLGWDDLGSYINRPRQMVGYGRFIEQMASFQWEYLTAVPYLLFGFNSSFGTVGALVVNWLAGVFALLTIIAFGKEFLGRGGGLVSAILYYTLPMVGYFSFQDLKIDNAVFFAGALSVFCLFKFLFPGVGKARVERGDWGWLVMAGIFGGLGFSFKLTFVLVLFMSMVVLAGAWVNWVAAIGTALLFVAVMALNNTLNLSGVLTIIYGGQHLISSSVVVTSLWVAGGVCLALGLFLKRKTAKRFIKGSVFFMGTVAVIILPWVMYNNIRGKESLPFPDLWSFPKQGTKIVLSEPSKRDRAGKYLRLPIDLSVDINNPACQPTAASEELDRYWGFGKGWGHFTGLIWRLFTNQDVVGYYVVLAPVLLLFPLVLFLPYFWSREGRYLRWLFFGTTATIAVWLFLGNGIPWYGIVIFLGVLIVVEALSVHADTALNRFLAMVLICFSLFTNMAARFWNLNLNSEMVLYAMGRYTPKDLIDGTFPAYTQIAQVVLARSQTISNRPYLYKAGTFIQYFVPRNLELIVEDDSWLDRFNCLYQERDAELTIKRLKALGFNSIIYTTQEASIEKDKNGTLHKKARLLEEFLSRSDLGIKILVNDQKKFGTVFAVID